MATTASASYRRILGMLRDLDLQMPITHPELGAANNFALDDDAIRRLVLNAGTIVGRLDLFVDRLESLRIVDPLERVEKGLGLLSEAIHTFTRAVNAHPSPSAFPQLVMEARRLVTIAVDVLTPALDELDEKILIRELALQRQGARALIEEVAKQTEGVRATRETADHVLEELRDGLAKQSAEVAAGEFRDRMNEHRTLERTWLQIGAGALAGFTTVLVLAIAWSLPDSRDAVALAHHALQFLLPMSALALVSRFAFSKFNLERNLRIIYAHRGAVLKEFAKFSDTIDPHDPADREAKHRMRLEMVKMLFTDPATGYIAAASTDVTVSPAVSIAETFLRPTTKGGA